MKPIIILTIILFTSCSGSVKPEQLQGTWDYVRVDNSNPEDSLTTNEIKLQRPSITFSPNSDLIIEWGGKQLSHGKFRLEGRMIRYTELLDGGQKREFPFLIKTITDSALVFVTMEQTYTKVTAVKR